MMGYGWGFGAWGMVVGFLAWAAVIFLVVWAATRVFPARSEGPAEKPADILKRRFARGEITREQLQEMIQVLEEH